MESVFAESPNRVFVLERGEIPNLKRPEEVPYPSVGPSISFPVAQVPWRNASVGPVTAAGNPVWQGKLGVDARWEHCIVVVDAQGNLIEDWTKWDSMLRRPHSITINPYDPEKHVWVVDDQGHAVYEFTNDGKQLVKTLGTPYQSGTDDKHFNRPTFINWLPDGTMYVTDGYGNTRVVKFDKDGKYLMAWGEPSNPPDDLRPGTFHDVHGVVFDVPRHRVFVTDRSDHRIADLRRERKIPRSVDHRKTVHAAVSLQSGRQLHLDRRRPDRENHQVRYGRSSLLRMGQPEATGPARCGMSTE